MTETMSESSILVIDRLAVCSKYESISDWVSAIRSLLPWKLKNQITVAPRKTVTPAASAPLRNQRRRRSSLLFKLTTPASANTTSRKRRVMK